MSSLQDQLLKAGLVSKDKATKTKSAKRKQAKINRKHKIDNVDEDKIAAQNEMQEKAEKARQLNQEKNEKAEEIAILAQIKQLIEVNKQTSGKPEISFNFNDGKLIKKIDVSNKIHRHLSNGLLNIARYTKTTQSTEYALVPKQVANKILQRSDNVIIPINVSSEEVLEDDPYADYQIPDDLMW